MQFFSFEDAPLHTRGENHRVGTFRYKDLGQGAPGQPGNFYLRWVLSASDFFSPRHFHNFDQVRLQLRGTFAFGEDGTMHPGTIGYFPESTPYGPQTSAEDTAQLVLQIGAPGGAGYVGEVERTAAVAALNRSGRFSGGRYFAASDAGGAGQDGFEAAWEQASGRKVRYARRRFERPMLVHPDAFEWLAHATLPGVRHKRLWDFGRQTVGCELYGLDAGAQLPLSGPLTAWVMSGAGGCSHGTSTLPYAPCDALHLEAAEHANLKAHAASEILILTHPVFTDRTLPGGAALPSSTPEHA
jgi:hypothetical protein